MFLPHLPQHQIDLFGIRQAEGGIIPIKQPQYGFSGF
jgi:hypothetical protein